jgi:flagellin-like hook-associated protein FlgL
MNLGNVSTLIARNHFDSAQAKHAAATRNIVTGSKSSIYDFDAGGLSASSAINSENHSKMSNKINLQNFLSFIKGQESILLQVDDMYQRMEQLAYSSLDVAKSEGGPNGSADKDLLNKEFQEISNALNDMLDQEFNGRRLFGGVRSDFTDGLQDRNDFTPTNLPQFITKDVMATSGKVTVGLCPGGAEDQIWVFQGEVPDEIAGYLVAPASGNSDTAGLTSKLYEYFDGSKDKDFQGIFTTGRWQTVGNSGAGRYDTFTIDFNTCDVELSVDYHDDNITSAGVLPANPSDADILAADYDKLFGAELKRRLELDGELLINAPSGNSSKITMIGVNTGNLFTYEVTASFAPSLPYNDLSIGSTDEIFNAISFGAIDCSDISTSENALKALDQIDAQKSLIYDSLAQIAAADSRYSMMIDDLDQQRVNLGIAHSRIVDADIAKEAVSVVKEGIRMQVSASAISKSTNMMDSLIELTTKHFRSRVLDPILR